MRRFLGLALALAVLAGPAMAQTGSGSSRRPVPEPAAGGPAAGRDPGKESAGRGEPVTIDADRMERFGKEGLVIFTGKVVARQGNSVQYADRMEVYFDETGERILRTVSTGTVRIITHDCRTGTARRAEYFELEQRMVLLGGARVWQDDNVVSGDTITIFLAQDRSVVQGGNQERVKAVFHPRDDKVADGRPRPAADATCVN